MTTLSSLPPSSFSPLPSLAGAADVASRTGPIDGAAWPSANLAGAGVVLHAGPSATVTAIDEIERAFLHALCEPNPD